MIINLPTKHIFKQYYYHKHFSAFYLQDGGEKRLTWIWNEITSLSLYVYNANVHMYSCASCASYRTYTLEIKKKQRGRCYRCSCLTCPGPKYTQLVESTGHPPASVWHGSVGIQTNPSPLCPGWQMHSNWAGPVTRHRAFSWHGGSADAQRSITAYTASPPDLTTILTSLPHGPTRLNSLSRRVGRCEFGITQLQSPANTMLIIWT